MFRSIRLENFKAYRDTGDVPLAPLTVIVGVNNSGKSTLLNAILALKQTAQDSSPTAALVTTGPSVNLNGFHDILHSPQSPQDPTFSISLTLDFVQQAQTPPNPQMGPRIFQVPNHLSATFGLDQNAKEIEVTRAAFALDGANILAIDRNGLWTSERLRLPDNSVFAGTCRNFIPTLALAPKSMPFAPSGETISFFNELSFSAHLWNHWLANMVHGIVPLRRRVPWSVSVGTRAPSEFGLGGENLVLALRGAERFAPKNATLLDYLNDWVSQNKILDKIHIEPDAKNAGDSLLGDELEGAPNINVAGMGEGISQILPIIARSIATPPNSCLLVEQPEIHLHPALQADMADLFIDVVKSLARQVIVETHSEHLLLRVRRRIAEGRIDPQNVSILYVERHCSEARSGALR